MNAFNDIDILIKSNVDVWINYICNYIVNIKYSSHTFLDFKLKWNDKLIKLLLNDRFTPSKYPKHFKTILFFIYLSTFYLTEYHHESFKDNGAIMIIYDWTQKRKQIFIPHIKYIPIPKQIDGECREKLIWILPSHDLTLDNTAISSLTLSPRFLAPLMRIFNVYINHGQRH